MSSFKGSICISDIPERFIQTASNGKKYVNVNISQRRGVGQNGETHYMKIYQPKANHDGVTHYIGNFTEMGK